MKESLVCKNNYRIDLLSRNVLLLSIKPKYSKLIFSNKKTIELRRVKTNKLKVNDIVVVYETAPTKAIVGYFFVKQVTITEDFQNNSGKFWRLVNNGACLSHEEFNKYYRDANVAIVIFISECTAFKYPILLKDIKERLNNFHPPQGYYYINDKTKSLLFENK